MIRAAIATLLLLLAGCQDTRPIVEPTSLLDVQASVSGLTPGTSTVVGQAVWTTRKGTRHYAIRKTVTLFSSTPYVLECIRITLNAKSDCTDLLKPYSRSATTDSAGRFTFTGLRHGAYVLTTDVCWSVDRGRARNCQVVQGEIEIQGEGQTVVTTLAGPSGLDTQP